MGVKFANNAYGTLNASISSSDASLTLASGQGARFPSLGAGDYFYCTLIDTSNNLEVVKCTARSSDVLTITRAQESTTARAFTVGDRVELRVTAAGLEDSTNYDAVLPSQTGNSGEFLTTNGTTASWATLPPSSDASALTTGTLADARLGSGAVLQTVYVEKTNAFSSSSQAWQDVTGLNLSITPQFSDSKILVVMNISMGGDNPWGGSHWRIKRNSTILSVGSTSGHQVNARIGGLMSSSGHGLHTRIMTILDSPATTSTVTYYAQAFPENDAGGGVIYVNTSDDPSTGYSSNGVSSIYLQEIRG